MKKMAILVSGVLLSTLSAQESTKIYAGLGVGSSFFSDGGYASDYNKYLKSVDDPYRLNNKSNMQAYKIYAGYNIDQYISLEVSYNEYSTHYIETLSENKKISDKKISPTSFAISTNISYGFGSKNAYTPYLQIGYANLNINQSENIYSHSNRHALRAGFGFKYNPSIFEDLAFKIAYEGDYINISGKNPNHLNGLKDNYINSLSMAYIAIEYKH